jgi:Arc/MetJ family transcription regulator
MSTERRARLSIDVDPELRRRIKKAAAARGLSVREYVEAILRQALEAEAQGEDAAEQVAWSTLPAHGLARHTEQDETSIRPLTRPEQERGLRTLEKLERLGRELLELRSGRPFLPSWELLDQARDERARALRREA